MSTVDLALRRAVSRASERDTATGRSTMPATALIVALFVLLLYAAFDHGAGGVSAAARIQVAIAAVATVAAGAAIWNGTLRLAIPGLALAGVALLALFAAWSGLTLAWSVAPDQTWSELNRALTYVVVLVLAMLAGASQPRALRLAAAGTLTVVPAVTIYAIGQKLVPGLHIPGLFNLNHTQLVPRLQDPFGYWNALGLFIAFGVPIALAVVLDRSAHARLRLGSLLSIELMLLTIGLTYSRGALLALVCGLITGIWLSRARLRSLMWIAVAAVATVPPLVFGLASHNLTTVSVGLGSRELAGAELALVLLISLAALWIGGERLMELERTAKIEPEQTRRIAKALATAAAVVVLCGLLAAGVSGSISHAWTTFTKTQETTNYDPGRLLSADSANRWVWWKEAAGAFSDRPLAGWGAGSFPVVHLLYRRDAISVQQPHSVPLQFLAETGIVGALLAIVGFGLLVAAGVRSVKVRAGPERLLAAALLAAVVTYTVHTLYDWDWDIPGVTLPALVLVGVLAGSRPRPAARGPARTVVSGRRGGAEATRVITLAAVTAVLCAFAVSGVILSVAASKAASALVGAASPSRSGLEHAQSTAASATRLDPLSDSGLLASATIALHLGNPERARAYLLQAIKREPDDVQAWDQLALTEILLRDAPNALTAIQRVAALDPMGRGANVLVREAEIRLAPPSGSATRHPSPVPVTRIR